MAFDTAAEIEHRIADYFDPRRNIVVPNVWWGWGLNHECDLVVLTNSGYAYEVEIKVSRADLRADLKKRHGHSDWNGKLRRIYFAVPERLSDYALKLIPKPAGLLMVGQGIDRLAGLVCKLREADINPGARRLNPDERFKLAKLGTMRVWTRKRVNPHEWRLEFLG
jgi:hypothetical protein